MLGIGGANYGTDGQVLTSTGASTAPAWEDASGGGGLVEGGTVVNSGGSTQYVNKFDVTGTTYYEPSLVLDTGSNRSAYISFMEDGVRKGFIGGRGNVNGLDDQNMAYYAQSGLGHYFYANDSGTATLSIESAGTGITMDSGSGTGAWSIKKSNIDHEMTSVAPTNVYGTTSMADGSGGGLIIKGLSDDDNLYSAMVLEGHLGGAAQVGKGTGSTGNGIIRFMANIKDGTGSTVAGSNQNLVSIDSNNSVKFIFDAEGTGHAVTADWEAFSDGRLKKNQEPLPYGLDEILQLTPKKFTRYSGDLDKDGNLTLTEQSPHMRNQIGFIAQEVKEIIPELVRDVDETEAFYSLNDGKIMAVAVKAIQELSAKITTLENRIKVLEA